VRSETGDGALASGMRHGVSVGLYGAGRTGTGATVHSLVAAESFDRMERIMDARQTPVISVMLAVPDAQTAMAWYKRAIGATELWNLGSVVGMEIEGAPIFLGEPERSDWDVPGKLGAPSCRVEVFCDDPDAFIARAVEAGAAGSVDRIRDHQMPWGPHRQGGFIDPFGHKWLVGDRSPLRRHP